MSNPVGSAVAVGATAGLAADITLAKLPELAPNLAEWLGIADKKASDIHDMLRVIEQHLAQIRRANEVTQISDATEVIPLSKNAPFVFTDRGYAHWIVFTNATILVTITVNTLAWNVSLAAGFNLVDLPGQAQMQVQAADANAYYNAVGIWTNRSYGNPI